MFPLIEFCESNLRQGSQAVFDQLMLREDVEVMSYGCMSECSICARSLFCMFEGERLVAATPTELLQKIEEQLTEWHQFFGV